MARRREEFRGFAAYSSIKSFGRQCCGKTEVIPCYKACKQSWRTCHGDWNLVPGVPVRFLDHSGPCGVYGE